MKVMVYLSFGLRPVGRLGFSVCGYVLLAGAGLFKLCDPLRVGVADFVVHRQISFRELPDQHLWRAVLESVAFQVAEHWQNRAVAVFGVN